MKDDLLAGREQQPATSAITIADLCIHWLTYKHQLLVGGELAERMFDRLRVNETRPRSGQKRTRIAIELFCAEVRAL